MTSFRPCPGRPGAALRGSYWVRTIPRAIRRAAAALTDSESARSDIARRFGVPFDRIHVVPLAVGADLLAPTEDVSEWLERESIRRPYVLALAATAPRKNTSGVLRVFKRVSVARPDVQLVLTGVEQWLRPTLARAIDELSIPSAQVRLLQFVDADQRNRLYAGASVLLFLSLYEGFGLPILEAMRCGAPVLCSNRSSCPEVAGDAAELVDPANEEAVANVLLQMLSVPSSQREQWRRPDAKSGSSHGRERYR